MRFPGARLVKLRLNDVAKMQIYSKVVVHKSLSPNLTHHQLLWIFLRQHFLHQVHHVPGNQPPVTTLKQNKKII